MAVGRRKRTDAGRRQRERGGSGARRKEEEPEACGDWGMARIGLGFSR
jgi:hypothetical protein